jgi:hypothetical protein
MELSESFRFGLVSKECNGWARRLNKRCDNLKKLTARDVQLTGRTLEQISKK